MSERLDRQLVAVMFTDMVGYTALMQADERLGLDKRDRLSLLIWRLIDKRKGGKLARPSQLGFEAAERAVAALEEEATAGG